MAQRLIFVRSGERRWRWYRDSENYFFCDIAFDRRGRLLGLAHVRRGRIVPPQRLLEIDLGTGETTTFGVDALFSPAPDGELVARPDGGGGLLHVRQSPYARSSLTEHVEIVEVEPVPAEAGCKITRLRSLDGCALFVGTGSSVLLSAADACRLKLKENCVYFADRWSALLTRRIGNGEDCGIYSLDDRTISLFTGTARPRDDDPASARWLPPIWVTPSLRRRPATTA